MTDLATRSARQLAGMIRRRQISSRELLDFFLGEIEARNGPLNAVVTLDVERARAAAAHCDEAVARGAALGPLHGLPMTIKDSFETSGLRTTAGAPFLSDHVPARDADAVARLKSAGAVVFGKTNLPLLASDLQSFNDVFGCTNNPHDLARSPGGSSGGAAVAVAAGFTSLELGSDIGGSIRTPANWTGIYGHKSSHGIVPHRGHIPALPGTEALPDLGVVGPLARSAEDLALALAVLAAPNENDAVGWRLELPRPRHERLSEFRVAAWLDDPELPVEGAVRGRLEATVEALQGAGVRVDVKARPATDLRQVGEIYQRLLNPISTAEMPDEDFASLVEVATSFGPEDASDAALGARASIARHRDWIAANEARQRLRVVMREFFADHDVLLCPVTPVLAVEHDHLPFVERLIHVDGVARPFTHLLSWIGLATACYLPATVAPVGRTREGLPVGVQILGPYLEDRTTIEFARLLEDVVGGFEPPLPGAS